MDTQPQTLDRVDLHSYLDRIGFLGQLDPTITTLAELQAAHCAAIPFENVDVLLGRQIRLDLASIHDKLISARRGGYCFEHNTLFAAVLRAVGYNVTPLEARVRPPGATRTLPRSHMTLRAAVAGRTWLVDVGFGANSPTQPVPLDGTAVGHPGGSFRVIEEPPVLVLQHDQDGTWSDAYSFTLQPALTVDYEVANHFTATHPQSIFVQLLTTQLVTDEGRYVLRGRTFTRHHRDATQSIDLDDTENGAVHRTVFRLGLDADEIEAVVRTVRTLEALPTPSATPKAALRARAQAAPPVG